MSWLLSIAGLLCGFSWLIFVHELGHFLLAKWNGVHVYVFSVGMGPYLLSFTWGETVYAISILPMGGYVKLAGQDDLNPVLPEAKPDFEKLRIDKDAPVAVPAAAPGKPKYTRATDFRYKRPGQKIAILAAGAIFNLIFALAAFTACYYFGVKMQSPVIGYVGVETAASKAQVEKPGGRESFPLKEGDRVVAVNGNSVRVFMDVMLEVAAAGRDNDIQIDIIREPARGPEAYPVIVRADFDEKSGAANLNLDPLFDDIVYPVGFECYPDLTVGSTPKEGTAAAEIGLKLFDQVKSVDGKKVERVSDINRLLQNAKGAEQELVYERDGKEMSAKFKAHYNENDKIWLLGVMFRQLIVSKVDPNSEAAKQGIKEHYGIVGINDEDPPIKAKGLVELAYVEELDSAKPEFKKVQLPLAGSSSALKFTYRKMHFEEFKARNLSEAISWAWTDLVKYSRSVFAVLKSIITRNVSMKAVSGPVGIAGVMLKVAENPFLYYLWFLAFLSVNLGMLQFVPLPLLDGWHILVVCVEKLKGGPLAPKFHIWAQHVGIVLILGLLLYATSNDIMRFFVH